MSAPSVLPTYKARTSGRNSRSTSVFASTVCSLVLFAPVMVFFFLSGLYLGSVIVEYHGGKGDLLEVTAEGILPKTSNVLNPGQLRGDNLAKRQSDIVAVSSSKEQQQNIKMIRANSVSTESTSEKDEESQKLLIGDIPSPSKNSYRANEISGFEVSNTLDRDNIAFGVWIYLDKLDGYSNMRTIFSNKATGCESSSERYGIAMYVNEWQTSDQKLYVEYGNEKSGCNKVSSNDKQLAPEKWYHVAVSFVADEVNLYIDGVNVGTANGKHSVQSNSPIQLGQYGNNEYPLLGNLSSFGVSHPNDHDAAISSVNSLRRATSREGFSSLGEKENIFAVYMLEDVYRKGESNSDIIGGLSAKVRIPPSTKSVAGVKIKLVDGLESGRIVTQEMKEDSDKLSRSRRENIKAAMQRIWASYKKYSWGMDELKPQTMTGSNNWGGLGVTLVDSLDTLWVMGLRQEFDEAAEWVKNSLTFSRTGSVSVFETTIRELGGLLSAYDLSKNKVFLNKAIDLGDRLIKSFGSGSIPHPQVDLSSGDMRSGWSGGSAILSELGTLQVEFRYLSMASGDPKYERTSMKALQAMHKVNPPNGLYPIKVGISTGRFTDQHITFGALGDSFYEYLLKVWIQGGKKETWLREMYDKSINGIMDKLLKASSPSGLAYVSDWDGRKNVAKMDHLVCFLPGVMALGAYTDPLGFESSRAQRDLAVAKALMYTCREMYHRTETGISPEFVLFPPGKDIDTKTSAPFYILRPETAESLFVLNQLTGDPIYRDWAYEIWTAIDKNCRLGAAYGSLRNVNMKHSGLDNRMESFFLAETLKYLYLAQDPDNDIDILNKYVFNTEAHPTRIFDDKHEPIKKS